jgi:hypothetical protein
MKMETCWAFWAVIGSENVEYLEQRESRKITSTSEVSAIRPICRRRHAEDKVETIHDSVLDPLEDVA